MFKNFPISHSQYACTKNLGNKETNFLPSCFSLQDWWFYCTCTFFQDSVLHWHTTWTFTDLEIVLIKFSCVWYTIKKFDLTSCWIKSLGVKSICQSVCIDTRIFLTSITNVRSALALKKTIKDALNKWRFSMCDHYFNILITVKI